MSRILAILGTALLAFFVLSVPVYALTKADDTVFVGADEVIDDDFYVAGSEVIIEGTVNGDVYAGASRIEIRGTVNGDVIAAANNIIVTGTISDDLRVAGNTISLVGAKIGDSVSVVGNELSIDNNSAVGGGLMFGGRSLSIDGDVGRGVLSGNQTMRIDSMVGRSVRVASDSIFIGQNAVIEGDLEYNSKNSPKIDGTVMGETIQKEGVDVSTEGLLRASVVAFNIWTYVAGLIVGLFLVLVFPTMFKRSYERFAKKPWPMIGWGALVLFAAIPAAILLFVTVFGIPLALTIILFWATAILFAKFFVGYTAGIWLLKQVKSNDKKYSPNVYWAMVLGLSLYYLLRSIPVLGMFVRLATTIVGFGLMLTLYRRNSSKKAE